MRLPSLAVLSTTLLPCATACLEFIGKVTGYSELGNPMLLTANMYDNGAWICLYHGVSCLLFSFIPSSWLIPVVLPPSLH